MSPLGCAMFSLHLQVPLNSLLGQRLPFLQHLAALAVVESVRTLPGYEVHTHTIKSKKREVFVIVLLHTTEKNVEFILEALSHRTHTM